ncbi:MAG: transglycosylase SLT domain-containing protein [Beijerinckiaceae bacterium]|nr:transglycosylase SLT domain-containing protein [Beijerinckiaceae bacterium]
MRYHRGAYISLCAAFLFQAGLAEAVAASDPPLPVARPAPFASPARSMTGTQLPALEAGRALGIAGADARKATQALIKKEAEKNGLPPDIADAVAAVESGYDPGAVGAAGEIGLMQVLPETAAMLGFSGDAGELAKPEVNIRYGVMYLSEAWRLTGGDLCRALMKYRAGHGEEEMSPLSVIYCGRARAHLAAAGSPFAWAASVPFVFSPPLVKARVARRGPPRNRTAAVSRAFWAAHEARVKAITQRVDAKWGLMASR